MPRSGAKTWIGIGLVGLASALAGSAVTIAASAADNPANASEYLSRAAAEARGLRWEAALADLDMALRINPHSGGIYLFRGSLEIRLGRAAHARADLEQAVALMPENADAWRLRGLARRDLGDYPGAEQDENRALDLDPLNLRAFYARGLIRMVRQEGDGALDDLTLVATLGPDSPELNVYRPRAILFLCRQDWAHAEEDLRHAARIGGTDDERSYASLALWVAGQARRGRAAADAELAAARAQPEPHWAEWPAALADYLLGKRDEAALLAEARVPGGVAGRNRTCEACCYIGFERLSRGDARGAQDSFRRCVRQGAAACNEHQLARAELHRLAAKVQSPVQAGRSTPSNWAPASAAAAVVAPIGLAPK